MIGPIYFMVIVLANTVGAISGMGGGVLIKPVFDLIHVHSVAAISFYSSVAVLTMSVVSTSKQISNGIQLKGWFACQLSVGAIIGGMLGNSVFELILGVFPSGKEVQLLQIMLTLVTLIFSFLHSKGFWKNRSYGGASIKLATGFLLGFIASLLGIGGGPINVALLMLLFNLPIKQATVYSIVIIFFSQFTKVGTILLTTDLDRYDLSLLVYIIPAAILGGFIGSSISGKVSDDRVNQIYQVVIMLVLLINCYNGWRGLLSLI